MTDKEWQKFLKWITKVHQLTKDWQPDRETEKMLEEYKKK